MSPTLDSVGAQFGHLRQVGTENESRRWRAWRLAEVCAGRGVAAESRFARRFGPIRHKYGYWNNDHLRTGIQLLRRMNWQETALVSRVLRRGVV